MEHERHAQRLPRAAGELGARGRRGRRQRRAAHVGEVDAAALEHRAVLDHARDAAAALGPLPGVAAERAAVDRLEARDDRVLQAGQVATDGLDVHGGQRRAMARWAMSRRYCAPANAISATAA